MRACLFAIAIAGCTSSTSSGHGTSLGDLQMNDLSLLMPLPTSQADVDAMLAPTAPARGGPLFPQTIYDMGVAAVDYSSLRAVAFRFDPCFGHLGAITDPSSCQNQLRIVFQPVTVTTESSPVLADAAVHAFYSMSRDDLLAAVDAIVAAREAARGDDDLGPLAPNPIVASEGFSGAFAQQLTAIITKYAGQANLVQFTSLELELFDEDLEGPGDFWSFQGSTVDHGSVSPIAIPTLPQAPNAMSLQAATDPLTATFSPVTTSRDNLSLLANFAQAQQATVEDRQSAFDAALRVLDPHTNSPNTIDCASCHMADPAVELVAPQLGLTAAGNPNAFVPDPSIPTADLAHTTQLVDGSDSLNIHAFSYRVQSPMINQRVIDETAANLAYIATLR